LNPLAANLLRTYVPIAVGAAAAWLAARGIQVDAQTQAAAIVAMTGVFQAAYYTIVRVLEEKWPAVGAVLLLSKPAISSAAPESWDDPHFCEDPGPWPPGAVAVPPHEPPQQPAPGPSSGPPVQAMPPASPLAATRYGGLADLVAQTRPDLPAPVRKADTGAIPAYRPPPGR
jgi:hypothetical protein